MSNFNRIDSVFYGRRRFLGGAAAAVAATFQRRWTTV